jgi:hypothetical protein
MKYNNDPTMEDIKAPAAEEAAPAAPAEEAKPEETQPESEKAEAPAEEAPEGEKSEVAKCVLSSTLFRRVEVPLALG